MPQGLSATSVCLSYLILSAYVSQKTRMGCVNLLVFKNWARFCSSAFQLCVPRVRLPPAYTSIHSYPSFIYVIYISAHDTRLARPSWSMLLITERHGTSKTPARVFLPSEKEAIVTCTLGARKSDCLRPRLPAGRRAAVKRSATPNDDMTFCDSRRGTDHD